MRARVVAPLAAALLGLAGGTITAVVVEGGAGTAGREAPPAQVRDPLGVGVAMVTLECDPGSGILVLGFGDTAPALRAALADNPDGEPRYLDTAESCDTTYGPERRVEPPRYAVFLGPFDDLEEPCAMRMDPARRGDFVTNLRSGNEMSVKCVCVLDDRVRRPVLRLGARLAAADAVWVRSLQGMFNDVDPEGFPSDWVTGDYDERTAERVRRYQETSSVASDPGVVDDETWSLLRTRICRSYDF